MAGTVYTVSGNVREQLGVEGAELPAFDTAAVSIVANNMDAIVKVAASLGAFASLDAVVAAVNAALNGAQVAQTGAETAEAGAVEAASGVDELTQLADDWARKLDAPVEGTDLSSKAYAQQANASAADADGLARSAAASATTASDASITADQIVNGPSGQEVTPGHFTMNTYIDTVLGIVAQAPVLGGRYINNAGIAGTETIQFAATDIFHTVEVNRASGHDVKLKCVQGLYTGPPPQGLDRSYAWVQVINAGAGDVTVEGPGDPGGGTVITVFPPKRIAYLESDYKVSQPGSASPSTKVLPAIPVPAGTGRAVTIITMSSWWSGTGHTAVVSSPNILGLTKQNTAGDGTVGNANPILCEIWTGTLADAVGGGAGPPLADLGVTVVLSPFYARSVVIVAVHQDCSGIENNFATARAGNATTVSSTVTPTTAQSANFIAAAFRGYTSAPAVTTVLPATTSAEDFNDNGVCQPKTTNNDPSWSVMNDAGLLATSYVYTTTAPIAAPAVIAGVTFIPRTVTTVIVGDDGLITDQTKPFTIAPKQQAFVLAASDGTSWYADK